MKRNRRFHAVPAKLMRQEVLVEFRLDVCDLSILITLPNQRLHYILKAEVFVIMNFLPWETFNLGFLVGLSHL